MQPSNPTLRTHPPLDHLLPDSTATNPSSPRRSWLIRAAAAKLAVLMIGVTIVALTDHAAVASPGPTANPPAHVDNPYLGAVGYVNPEWKAEADQVPGGSRVSNTPTSIWVDQVAIAVGSLNSRRGLRNHLEAALAQEAGYVQVVINNLPGKDCDRDWYDNAEFTFDEVDRYQREFIDPIAAIEANPRYRSLRIINIVEPRWVQNLVLHTGSRYEATEACDMVAETGSFVAGVRYALTKLHQAGPNVYTYLDAGVYYEFGWDDNAGSALRLIADTVRGTPDGFASVDGFATNIGGYAPLTEPYFTIDTTVNGVSVKQTKWVDWNNYVDELPYAMRVRTALVQAGFSPKIGMIIDTSRNGWGGARRPTKQSVSRDLNTFVDESRIDRRRFTWNWCNQPGAGLGERPVAAPRTGIDAYTWIKVPGESDGASSRPSGEPPGGFDIMCDPTYSGTGGGSRPTGAMPGAPSRREWFPAAFTELLNNAYPPLR